MTSEVGAFPAPTRAPRSLFWLGEARGWCDTMVRITDHQRCRINQPLLRPGVASVAQSYTHTALPSCTGAFPGERENEEGLAGKAENNLCERPGSARDPVRTQ